MHLISTGKFKKPLYKIKYGFYYDKKMIYKYYLKVLFKKIPITSKEYTMINNILERNKNKNI